MWRQNQQIFGRFLLCALILLEFCKYQSLLVGYIIINLCLFGLIGCTTFCQLQRTSNSACGNIVCPGEPIQYECVVGTGIDIVLWRVSGCEDTLEILYQQGMGVQQAERACGDGKNLMANLQQINVSSLRSILNITGVQFNLTIECLSDDGAEESSIGTNALISTGMLPQLKNQSLCTFCDLV